MNHGRESPDRDEGGWRARTTSWRLLFVAAGTVGLLFSRCPEAFLTPHLWAEDGIIFLGHAVESGVGSLGRTYGGYHHLLPRLVAWLAMFPPAWFIPAIYLWSSVAVTVAVACHAAAVFSRAGGWHGWLAGSAAGLAVVAAPHTGEVFVNLTNVQWIGALGLVLLLVEDPPRSRRATTVRLIWAALLSLTGPFSVILVLLFWCRFAFLRTRCQAGLALVVTAGAAVNLVAISSLIGSSPGEGASLWLALGVMLDRTLGVFFALLSSRMGRLVLELVTLAVGTGLVAVAWRRGEKHESQRILLLALAISALSAAVFVRFSNEIGHLTVWENGDRYFYVQRVLLLWLVALLAQAGPATAWNRSFVNVVVVLTLLGTSRNWRDTERPDRQWGDYAPYIDRGEAVRIPLNPEGWWYEYPGRKESAD